MDWVWLLLGVVILTGGAELLVRGASAVALALRVTPLVVGLTVVAFGTSAPELVVSLQSSLQGNADIALGNVVGSNIFNVLLILGLSAVVAPLVVDRQLIRFDVPVMIGLSFLVAALGYDGTIGRIDGSFLAAGLVAYVVWLIRTTRSAPCATDAAVLLPDGERLTTAEARRGPLAFFGNLALVLVGLGLLVAGAQLFLDAAISIARAWGLSELVIGLTLVAGGTSLPELATSLIAAIRGQREIAVGNVVGSNIFNILGVLGLSGLVSANGVAVPEAALAFDIPVMILVAVVCLPVFFTGHRIARWEGAIFLAYYGAYVTQLILAGSDPDAGRSLQVLVVGYLLPLTALTLATTSYRYWRICQVPK